ncbi:hypothetical protein BZA77DRAFT_348779 [Pyronema omphalodes]|nr:hypothetical protein BZA77DRAFT_348779 [Pyronema omphalodes]
MNTPEQPPWDEATMAQFRQFLAFRSILSDILNLTPATTSLNNQHAPEPSAPTASPTPSPAISTADAPATTTAPIVEVPSSISDDADLPSSEGLSPSVTQPIECTTESPVGTTDVHKIFWTNSRWILNHSMGVKPSDRVAVQRRRAEVRRECERRNHTLDKVYRDWDKEIWVSLVRKIHPTFQKRYNWTAYVTERVMKSICSDTARTVRSRKLKKQRKEGGIQENQAQPEVPV